MYDFLGKKGCPNTGHAKIFKISLTFVEKWIPVAVKKTKMMTLESSSQKKSRVKKNTYCCKYIFLIFF